MSLTKLRIKNENNTYNHMIPSGTRIFLTRKPDRPFCIRPDTILHDDALFVTYDVLIDNVVAIPRGTRVLGDWITESIPEIAAQFQIHTIFLTKAGQKIQGDSALFNHTVQFNYQHVNGITHMNLLHDNANSSTKFVSVNGKQRAITNIAPTVTFIMIPTQEISVILTSAFEPEQIFHVIL